MNPQLPTTPREELLWLAALLEGEGHFGLNGGYPNIVLNMTDSDVVEAAHRIAGVGNISGPYKSKRKKTHKSFWRWKVSYRPHVFALCRALLPFMGERRSKRIEEILALEPKINSPIWERVAHWEQG
jgi:hypothetical protein